MIFGSVAHGNMSLTGVRVDLAVQTEDSAFIYDATVAGDSEERVDRRREGSVQVAWAE